MGKRARTQETISAISRQPAVSWQAGSRLLRDVGMTHLTDKGFQSAVRRHMKMARAVFREIPCLDTDGESHIVVAAELQMLLQYVCSRAPAWGELMRKVAAAANAGGRPLQLVLFMDECRGGNILSPLPSKKLCLFHVSLADFPPRYLLSADGWLPFAVVPSMLAEKLDGGMSRAARAVLSQLSGQKLNCVRIHEDVYARFTVQACVADMEGVRQLYTSKGAAALRPCLLCGNVVKKDSGLVSGGNSLLDVSSHRRERFAAISDADIFDLCDRLLRSPPAVQKDLVRLEQTSGIVFDPQSLLFDTATRETLPPSRILFDPLHCYFQNGVAAVEAACLVAALKSQAGVGLEDLAAAATAVTWRTSAQRQSRGGLTATRLRRLFDEKLWSERMFRGEVKDLRDVLPVLYFLADRRAQEQGVLNEEMESMEALMDLLHLDFTVTCLCIPQ